MLFSENLKQNIAENIADKFSKPNKKGFPMKCFS